MRSEYHADQPVPALPLALIHPAFMVTRVIMTIVIMTANMLVITLMIVVTGSAKAVSVC